MEQDAILPPSVMGLGLFYKGLDRPTALLIRLPVALCLITSSACGQTVAGLARPGFRIALVREALGSDFGSANVDIGCASYVGLGFRVSS